MTLQQDNRISLIDLGITQLRFSDAAYTLAGKEIGRGGSCLVYHALKEDPHAAAKRVLLKEFYPIDVQSEQWRRTDGSLELPQNDAVILQKKQRFLESYKLFRRLYNEDTLNLYTAQAGCLLTGYGTVYIEEDYSSAVSLEHYITQEAHSLFEFLSLMKDLGTVVSRVHALGYIQLDLKPGNLLCVDNRLIRLIDTDTFLLQSDLLSDPPKPIALSSSMGFTAPEIAWYAQDFHSRKTRKNMAKYGNRADIYAFGCILCYFLFGESQDPAELFSGTKLEVCLRKMDSSIPGKAIRLIRDLLRRTTARLLNDRYSSIDEAVSQLAEILTLVVPKKIRIADNFHRNPYPVIGREEKLSELSAKMAQQTESARIVFISGPGGVGKSTLARYYAETATRYDIIAETSAGSVEEAIQKLRILNWEPDPEQSRQELVQQCLGQLASLTEQQRTLLIIHDYNTSEDSAFGLLFNLNCDIILTSRQDWRMSGIPTVMLECEDLSPERQSGAARALFLQFYLQQVRMAGDREQERRLLEYLDADTQTLDQLLARLDWHPLSLKLMARQMSASPGRERLPGQALRELQREGFHRDAPVKFQNDQGPGIRWTNIHGHLSGIFLSSFHSSRFSPEQLETLRYMLVVSSFSGISSRRFQEWTHQDPEPLEQLRELGWLDYHPYRQDPLDTTPDSGVYTLPLAIREVIQQEVFMGYTTENSIDLMQKLSSSIYSFPGRIAWLSFCEQQKKLIRLLQRERTPEYAQLLLCAEHGLHETDGGKDAGRELLEYGKRRLEIYQTTPDSAELQIHCCNQLSRYCYELGDLSNALMYQEHSLALEQANQIPPDENLLTSRLNLSNLLWESGKWDETLTLARSLAEVSSSQLGDIHILSLNARYNLGYYLFRWGNHSDAEDILWDVIQICQSDFDSPGVAERELIRSRSLFTLGQLYQEVSYAESAVTCLQQAHKIYSRWWGEDHLFCAKILCELASALVQFGDSEAALSSRVKALTVYQKNLEGQLYRAANCLMETVLDCRLVPGRQELGEALWEQACLLYNSEQSAVSVESFRDALTLLNHRGYAAIQDGVIHEGLQLLEEYVRLCRRVFEPAKELRREYSNLGNMFSLLGLPDRGSYYRQLANDCQA